MRKYHLIYKTTCLVTGKWYVGMHSTDSLDDGYLGSGQQLRRSIMKHGLEEHICEVLELLPTREALILREEELITDEMRKDPYCMNLRNGGTGNPPGMKQTSEINARRSASLKRTFSRPEVREKKIAAHNRPEARARNSAAQKLAQSQPHLLAMRKARSKPCTIDGISIYPSLIALIAERGQGKRGMRHPDFRYV
jgi:hypothetical protein